MLTSYGILAILGILVLAILALVVLVWLLMPPSGPKPPTGKTDARTEVKTQPVVQKFISNDLKKRAFVVRLNEGGFKVIYERYSTEVINRGGEVAGWQALPDKPVMDSLASAVEVAQNWVHAND
jgi:hypothetical protein